MLKRVAQSIVVACVAMFSVGCGGGGGGAEQGQADLIIVDSLNNPNPVSSVQVGDTVYFYFGIKNVGTVDVTRSFTTKFSNDLGAVYVFSVSVPIAAGETIYSNGDLFYTATAADVGTRTLSLELDTHDEVPESNENNNIRSANLTVLAAANG